MQPLIEICLDNLDSVISCEKANIERIELCAGLVEGGTTPSIGFVKSARSHFSKKIMMMIRPRGGDFYYSDAEIDLMRQDILAARDHGIDGFVFGCLTPLGKIDEEKTKILLEAANESDVTFHRAFDVSDGLAEALETLIKLGIRRVLTSGGEADVWKGISNLHALVLQASGRISILAGGGVRWERIPELLNATGVSEVHLSSRITLDSPMIFRRPDIPMGTANLPKEYERKVAGQISDYFGPLADKLNNHSHI